MNKLLILLLMIVCDSVSAAQLNRIIGTYDGTIKLVESYAVAIGAKCTVVISADEYKVEIELGDEKISIDRKSVVEELATAPGKIKLTRHLGERSFEIGVLIMGKGGLKGVLIGRTSMGGYGNPAHTRRMLCGQLRKR